MKNSHTFDRAFALFLGGIATFVIASTLFPLIRFLALPAGMLVGGLVGYLTYKPEETWRGLKKAVTAVAPKMPKYMLGLLVIVVVYALLWFSPYIFPVLGSILFFAIVSETFPKDWRTPGFYGVGAVWAVILLAPAHIVSSMYLVQEIYHEQAIVNLPIYAQSLLLACFSLPYCFICVCFTCVFMGIGLVLTGVPICLLILHSPTREKWQKKFGVEDETKPSKCWANFVEDNPFTWRQYCLMMIDGIFIAMPSLLLKYAWRFIVFCLWRIPIGFCRIITLWFRLIHSEERLLCAFWGVIGGLITWYATGEIYAGLEVMAKFVIIISSGVLSAVLGHFVGVPLVARRWLKIESV